MGSGRYKIKLYRQITIRLIWILAGTTGVYPGFELKEGYLSLF
jgi:hypothetical protein